MKITAHFPTTKEGWEKLEDAIAEANAHLIVNWIMRQNCSASEKRRMLNRVMYGPESEEK